MWFKGCDDSSLSREAIVFFRDLALLQAVLEMHRAGEAKCHRTGKCHRKGNDAAVSGGFRTSSNLV